jgi:hypothetical protein
MVNLSLQPKRLRRLRAFKSKVEVLVMSWMCIIDLCLGQTFDLRMVGSSRAERLCSLHLVLNCLISAVLTRARKETLFHKTESFWFAVALNNTTA